MDKERIKVRVNFHIPTTCGAATMVPLVALQQDMWSRAAEEDQ